LPSHPCTLSNETRASMGRQFHHDRLTPRDSARRRARLAPARPQTSRLPSRSQEACRSAFRRYRTGEDPPLSERRFFAPSVRVCLSSMPVNPDAQHSHQPRYPSLAPVRGHCGLSAAAVEDAGVIRAEPQSPLRMHWRNPKTDTLRQTRVVFALHPSPPKTASPGSGLGCPAFRPVSRFSPVAAEPSFRKWPPLASRARCSAASSRRPGCRRRVRQEAKALVIRLRQTGGPPSLRSPMRCSLLPGIARYASDAGSLTCLQSRPPARLFSYETARRAVRAAQVCPHWRSPLRGSVEGLYES
jgi:hypothetical protein